MNGDQYNILDGTSLPYSKFVHLVPHQACPGSLSDHTPILKQHHEVSRPLFLPCDGELESNRKLSRRMQIHATSSQSCRPWKLIPMIVSVNHDRMSYGGHLMEPAQKVVALQVGTVLVNQVQEWIKRHHPSYTRCSQASYWR